MGPPQGRAEGEENLPQLLRVRSCSELCWGGWGETGPLGRCSGRLRCLRFPKDWELITEVWGRCSAAGGTSLKPVRFIGRERLSPSCSRLRALSSLAIKMGGNCCERTLLPDPHPRVRWFLSWLAGSDLRFWRKEEGIKISGWCLSYLAGH